MGQTALPARATGRLASKPSRAIGCKPLGRAPTRLATRYVELMIRDVHRRLGLHAEGHAIDASVAADALDRLAEQRKVEVNAGELLRDARSLGVTIREGVHISEVRPATEGWREYWVAIESIEHGARQWLSFGDQVRVLEPPELRRRAIDPTMARPASSSSEMKTMTTFGTKVRVAS